MAFLEGASGNKCGVLFQKNWRDCYSKNGVDYKERLYAESPSFWRYRVTVQREGQSVLWHGCVVFMLTRTYHFLRYARNSADRNVYVCVGVRFLAYWMYRGLCAGVRSFIAPANPLPPQHHPTPICRKSFLLPSAGHQTARTCTPLKSRRVFYMYTLY